MATRFDVPEDTVSSTVVADNSLMAIYFFVLITIPALNFFRSKFSTPDMNELDQKTDKDDNQAASYWQRKEISLSDIAMAIGTAFAIVAVSFSLAGFFSDLIPEDSNIFLSILRGVIDDDYLMLTILTLLLVAVFPKYFDKISGSQEFGTSLGLWFTSMM